MNTIVFKRGGDILRYEHDRVKEGGYSKIWIRSCLRGEGDIARYEHERVKEGGDIARYEYDRVKEGGI